MGKIKAGKGLGAATWACVAILIRAAKEGALQTWWAAEVSQKDQTVFLSPLSWVSLSWAMFCLSVAFDTWPLNKDQKAREQVS